MVVVWNQVLFHFGEECSCWLKDFRVCHWYSRKPPFPREIVVTVDVVAVAGEGLDSHVRELLDHCGRPFEGASVAVEERVQRSARLVRLLM